MISTPMYPPPLDLPSVLGWVLVVVVGVLCAARAARLELRPAGPRRLDRVLDVALVVAVVGLVAALVGVVLVVFG